MSNTKLKELVKQATHNVLGVRQLDSIILAELIVQECINKIETYKIPVGNSPSGELACEWTYEALKTIRDDIKQHFGLE